MRQAWARGFRTSGVGGTRARGHSSVPGCRKKLSVMKGGRAGVGVVSSTRIAGSSVAGSSARSILTVQLFFRFLCFATVCPSGAQAKGWVVHVVGPYWLLLVLPRNQGPVGVVSSLYSTVPGGYTVHRTAVYRFPTCPWNGSGLALHRRNGKGRRCGREGGRSHVGEC